MRRSPSVSLSDAPVRREAASASSYTLASIAPGYLCFNWKNLCTRPPPPPTTRETNGKRTADKLSGSTREQENGTVLSFHFVCRRELMASLLSLSRARTVSLVLFQLAGRRKKRGQLHCGARGARLISQLRAVKTRTVSIPFHCESINAPSVPLTTPEKREYPPRAEAMSRKAKNKSANTQSRPRRKQTAQPTVTGGGGRSAPTSAGPDIRLLSGLPSFE